MNPKRDVSPKEKKGRWRLSNLLHPKDGDQRTSPEARTEDQPGNSTSETLNSDSAYGGSGPSSTTGVPTISDSQAKAQDAEIKTSTDESTGKTITTTTTTTTTTVTTTTGDHFQVPAGQQVVVKQGNQNEGPVELSARPLSQSSGSATATNSTSHPQTAAKPGPSIPQKDSRRRSHSPNNAHPVSAIDTQFPSGNFFGSQDQHASSPGRHNFSYPARTPPVGQSPMPQYNPSAGQPLKQGNSNGAQQSQYQAYNPPAPHAGSYDRPRPVSGQLAPHDRQGYGYGQQSAGVSPVANADPQHPSGAAPDRPSTVQSLKTAAAGIHGAGETLRGTFNSSIARHTHAPPDVVAAHDAVAARGRAEIETGRFYKPVPKTSSSSPSYRNPPAGPSAAAAAAPPDQPDQPAGNRLQPTASNPRYSAETSANAVLSQVPGVPQQGKAGPPYFGGSAAVGTEREDAAGAKKKGGLRNVLRKSREGLKT